MLTLPGRLTRVCCAVLITGAVVNGCAPSPGRGDPTPAAERAAEMFLDRFVGTNGRVVRWDQGGDTVSEGQAYALVVASALGWPARMERVWDWTEKHLLQPNGLPAWRIDASGIIADVQSASDADVLMAWALSRVQGEDHAHLRAAGLRLSEAVLDNEVIVTPGGRHLLAAGPWAVELDVVNVSYWSSKVFSDLAELTDDPRWARLAGDAPRLLAELTDNGRLLPPDWAVLRGEKLEASPSPVAVASSPSLYPQYGLDAQRTVVWSVVSCDESERFQSARWHQVLGQEATARAMTLTLDGGIIDPGAHPVPLVAAAAAADAADAGAVAEELLTSAELLYEAEPTFFGAAWIALGRILIDDTLAVNECAP